MHEYPIGADGKTILGPDGTPTGDLITYHDGLGVSDLYMRWIPDDSANGGHYEAKDKNGVWTKVTQVAADELLPYQAYYAVWSEFFNVVYSYDYYSNPDSYTTYKIPIIESKIGESGTGYNLVDPDNTVKGYELPGVSEDCLYGGYYKNSPPPAEGVDWAIAAAQTESGRAMKSPEAKATYYVKEVPKSEKYLRSIIRYTYKLDTNKVTWLCALATIDDPNYSGAGFVINGEAKPGKAKKTSVKIQNGYKTDSVTVNRNNFGGDTTKDLFALVSYYVDFDVSAGQSYTITPYWTTIDGIEVVGPKTRLVEIDENQHITTSEQ